MAVYWITWFKWRRNDRRAEGNAFHLFERWLKNQTESHVILGMIITLSKLICSKLRMKNGFQFKYSDCKKRSPHNGRGFFSRRCHVIGNPFLLSVRKNPFWKSFLFWFKSLIMIPRNALQWANSPSAATVSVYFHKWRINTEGWVWRRPFFYDKSV